MAKVIDSDPKTSYLAQFAGWKYVCNNKTVQLEDETPIAGRSDKGTYDVTCWRCPVCNGLHYYDRENAFDDYDIHTGRPK